MTRKEFMRQLDELLRDLPESDRQDALLYYEDYFDEAGPENEAALIQELGSPEKVAATMRMETGNRGNEQGEYTEYGYSSGQKTVHKNTPAKKQPEQNGRGPFPLALIIVILVLTSPIWIGVVSGIFGTLVGILAAFFGCMVALVALIAAGLIGGAGVFVVGLTKLPFNPALGLFGIGIGTLLIAIGLLLLVFFLWLIVKALPAVFCFVVNLCQKAWRKIRGGNKNE